MTKYWFKKKDYGWGWRPNNIYGYLVVIAYILLVVRLATKIDSWSDLYLVYIPRVVLLTAIFVYLCYLTGEKKKPK